MKTKTIVTAIMAGAISVMPVVAQTLSEKSNRSTRDVSRRVDAGRTKKAKSGLREVRKMRQHIAPVLSGKLGAAPASGYVPNLRGSVNFSNLMNNPYADFQVGLYDVPSHEHEFDRIFAGPDASLGGVVKDGIYYCANMEDYVFVQFFHLYAYDMATGQLIASSGNVTGDLSCMGSGGYALDPVSGDVYGITLNRTGEGFQLSKVDFSIEGEKLRATSTKIGDLQGRYNAFAIDPEGQFYGIRYDLMDVSGGQAVTGSGLYKINRETAEETRIGATGYAPFYNSSATIDPESGRMFWTLSPADESGWLMEVDLATGQATPVIKYENSEEITGLYVAGNNDAKAPAYLTGVEANFEGPSLSGTIKMHTPALLVDGTPGSGTLDVKVYAGDKLLATASAVAYGADVEVPVTVEAPGLYDLKMVPVNAAGEGPAAKIRKKYLGKDYPRTPEVTLTYQNGFMQIDWNAVNSSQHGGYMDASNIYYRVERVASNKPEGVVIAGALTTNQFGETITPTDELVYYRYAVYPVADGMVGEPGYSNSVKTGTIVYPPFTSDLTTGMQEYTVVDGNNDKRYWVWLDQLGAAGISYHETNKMNDWLISPVVKLEGGKAYKIDLKAYADRAMFPERIEIFAGRQPKAASMTMPVMGPTDIDWEASDMKVVDGMLAVKETGDYYIGFHAISDPNTSAIYLKEWSIAECSSAYAPAAAAGLTVTPNAEFGLSAEISFTAPSVDMLGDELRGLNGLEVRRDGVRVQSWRDPQPGESYTFTDEVPKTGWYEYSVIASNKDGEGQPAKVKVFIGITRPGALESCTISRTDTDGEVRLDWTPVTVGEDGRPMNPDLVKYNIYTFNNLGLEVLLMEGVEGSSYTFQAIKPGRQDFVQCVVYPVTATGEGGGQVTEMIPVGTPYPGIEETFADGKLHYVWGAEASNDNVRYGVYTTADSQITAVNNDNGFFAMQGSKENDYVDFFTGMINLAGMESPGVSLYVLNMGSESGANDNHNQVMIYVRDVQGGEYQLLKNTELCATGMAGNWNYVSAPLTAFAGKKVQVLIRALVKSHALVCYDNVSVRSMAAHDLALASLAAPAAAMVGRDFKVTATVTNLGMLTSGEYTVELYKDGEKVAEQNGNELGSGASADYTFMLQMSPMTEEPVKLQAKVVYAQDTNQADNQSEEVSVEPKESNLPDAENLFGSVEDGIVKLSWDAPALDPVSEEIEESFESAAAFADNYEDWIFIDVDGEPVGGFNGLSVPGITAGQTASSFRVWDQSILGNGSYAAHSGNKYLFSLYRQDDGEVDDWAISPELDGSAQTITFYAKSYHTQFSEKLWIYTSKGSVNPDDFKIVRLVGGVVPSDWTEYTFTVPEGTKRFAIRCVSKGGFMLMVDDVKFTPKSNEPLELNGYNIWRDGSKLNSAVHESREFADSNVEPGNAYIYTVTSLFKGKGESAGSEPIDVFVETSSVNAPGAGLEVEKVGHTLVVRNPGLEEVRVVKADGITLHNSTGQAEIRIDVTPGVYFVKTRKVAKAVVIN